MPKSRAPKKKQKKSGGGKKERERKKERNRWGEREVEDGKGGAVRGKGVGKKRTRTEAVAGVEEEGGEMRSGRFLSGNRRYRSENYDRNDGSSSESDSSESDSSERVVEGGGGGLRKLMKAVKRGGSSMELELAPDNVKEESEECSEESVDESDDHGDNDDVHHQDEDEEEEEEEEDGNISSSSSSSSCSNSTINSMTNYDSSSKCDPIPYIAHFAPPSPSATAALQTGTTTKPLTFNNIPGFGNEGVKIDLSTNARCLLYNATIGDDRSNGGKKNGGRRGRKVNKVKVKRGGEGKAKGTDSKGTDFDFLAASRFYFGRGKGVKDVLRENFQCMNRLGGDSSDEDSDDDVNATTKETSFTPSQAAFFPPLATYSSILSSTVSFDTRADTHRLIALHTLNHCLTSLSLVRANDKLLRSHEEKEDGESLTESLTESQIEMCKDQGFTQPKILILTPTRGSCLEFVRDIVGLTGVGIEGKDGGGCGNDEESSNDKSSNDRVQNLDRFENEFGMVENAPNDSKTDALLSSKGLEWNSLFGPGQNADDDFKIGLSFRSKSSKITTRIYSEFYSSDMIIASPLGLKMAVGAPGDSSYDVDFLSSIEVVAVMHADTLMMQNWEHVNTILELLHQKPKKDKGIDFSRLRDEFLTGSVDGKDEISKSNQSSTSTDSITSPSPSDAPPLGPKNYRQLIITSAIQDANINATFKHGTPSPVSGVAKIRRKISAEDSATASVLNDVRQVFQKIHCLQPSDAGPSRLKYFADVVLPQLEKMEQKHTLIFIPSYFEFIAVRNLLLRRESSFVQVTEYARTSEISRGRSRFYHGQKSIMLYTGRCHFFKRHAIRGARHLIFFGIPEHPDFYADMVNGVESGGEGGSERDVGTEPKSCLVLFTKYEAFALEGVVGTDHMKHMVKSEKKTFMLQ